MGGGKVAEIVEEVNTKIHYATIIGIKIILIPENSIVEIGLECHLFKKIIICYTTRYLNTFFFVLYFLFRQYFICYKLFQSNILSSWHFGNNLHLLVF